MKTIQSDVSLELHRLHRLLGGVVDDDAANFKQTEQSKSISILSPQVNDNVTLFYTRYPVTLQALRMLVRGTAPSVTATVKHAADRSTSGTAIVSGEVVTNTTLGVDPALSVTDIPANSWFWLNIDAVSGTATEFHLTLFYRIDSIQNAGFSDGFDPDGFF